MNRFIRSKKAMAATGLAVGLTLASGLTAFAFWTTSGNGSGTATAGSASITVTSVDIPASPALGPISAAQAATGATPVGIKVSNAGDGAVQLTSVVADTSSPARLALDGTTQVAFDVVKNAPHTAGTCDPADFVFVPGPVNTLVPKGALNQVIANVGSVYLLNTASNQDGCQGATVTLHVTAS
jgi:hypothetical protein